MSLPPIDSLCDDSLPVRILRLGLLALCLVTLHRVAFADAIGTGFFVSADGLLVTNNHVIADANELRVQMRDGSERLAHPVVVDRSNDLAVLKVKGVQGQAFLQVRHSRTVVTGTEVFTIGFPLVSIQGSEPKITHGIVSSLSGLADDPTTYQISVPLQAGNSGGPLVALDGSVVGVVTAKLDVAKVQRVTGDVPQNVNYALKSAYLLELFGSRSVAGRVRPSGTLGPSLHLAEVVKRTEPAVARVLALGGTKDSAVASSHSASPSPSEQPPQLQENGEAHEFSEVKFAIRDAYLEVLSLPRRTEVVKTTLKPGDRSQFQFRYESERSVLTF